MTTPQHVLDFYTRPGAMTSGGEYAPLLAALPRDLDILVHLVQGLLLHEHWASAYDVTLSDQRRSASHIRPVERMLARLFADDGRPLTAARPVDTRLVGVCRHFTALLVAMLRAHGVPARARCGFARYFKAGHFEDHWVCETWKSAEKRWVLVDAQMDALQQATLHLDFDVLDVPRDCFVTAGEAWTQCRAGDADPSTFGIFDMHGLWFVTGNLLRDLAALNNMEMLPWDTWGAMASAGAPLQEDQRALFDRAAAAARAPDADLTEVHALYGGDGRLRVPATVFNAVRNRLETI